MLCAKHSRIDGVYDHLKELTPAYVDMVADPVRYIIPERWCDEKEAPIPLEEAEALVSSFLSEGEGNADSYHLRIAVETLRNLEAISNEKLADVLQRELNRQSYGIRQNPLVQYLVETLPAAFSDAIITKYISDRIQENRFYIDDDLPMFALWRVKQEGIEYCKSGLDALIGMHNSWLTSAGHFPAPTVAEAYGYANHVDWTKATDLRLLFYQIIKYIILSEDADATRVALSGLFALIRTNNSYIEYLERDWSQFHYRAKEWIMMIYELLLDLVPECRESVLQCVKLHCDDEAFNVALYANILLDNCTSHGWVYIRKPQAYFEAIPLRGQQRLLKLPKNAPWVDGSKYVVQAIEQLQSFFGHDFSDLETRTVAYSQKTEVQSPFPLNRRRINGGYRVVLDPTHIAFLRVLYKDWVSNRWSGGESDLARIVLSSSEPYIMLMSPSCWSHNSGFFFGDINDFQKQPKVLQQGKVLEVLRLGLTEDDYLLGGSIIDYTHRKEIICASVCYLGFDDTVGSGALYVNEKNSRLLLQSRDDFEEYSHFNITLHHSGIESFQLSGIICGLSKTALMSFGWRIRLSSEGFRLIDDAEQEIGRFEFYYGNRDTDNRYSGNQPQLQRWIVKKQALEKASTQTPRGASVKTAIDVIVRNTLP